MARNLLTMSLFFATFLFSSQSFSSGWYLYYSHERVYDTSGANLTVYYRDQDKGGWCHGNYAGTDKRTGESVSGSIGMSGTQCRAEWRNSDDSLGIQVINQQSGFTRYCNDGQRPQDAFNSACQDFSQHQCPENQVIDPVTGYCQCADGAGEMDETYTCQAPEDPEPDPDPDNGGGEPQACNDSDSCAVEATTKCEATGQSVHTYTYYGNGKYNLRCGFEEYQCPDGHSWNKKEQSCQIDSDGDGTSDYFDPEPDNPEEDGDSDGDGVPDSQDSHPQDPNQWNSNGNGSGGYNGSSVDPIGQSDKFDDTAIVSALNENTQTTNATNDKLNDLLEQGSIANDALGQSNAIGQQALGELGKITDLLGQGEPNGKGADDLQGEIDGELAEAETKVVDEFNKDLDEALFVDKTMLPNIETVFGNLELERCEDISNFLFTLELCSLAPRINPILYWALAAMTLISCWHMVIETLKRDYK
jgi:hypothetical protein